MNRLKYIIFIIIFIVPFFSSANNGTTKKERNYITDGNEAYENGDYQSAISMYEEALKLNPGSQIAEFNLASALVNLPESSDKESKTLQKAIKIFTSLSSSSSPSIAQKSKFNLGHIAYNQKNYQQSIEYYKKVLRNDPRNDKARRYLRMAQLQLQNQNSQNKENKQEKEKNKDKNQENDNEKNKQSEKEKDKQQDEQKQDKQPPKPQHINDANAEKILKSIENKEQETLLRMKKRNANAMRTDKNANGSYTEKPW